MRTKTKRVITLLAILCGLTGAGSAVATADPITSAPPVTALAPPSDEVDPASVAGHPASDLRLTRDDILTRGKSWIDEGVPYSQSAYHTNQYGRYRQDCSGYVSMAWGLQTSHWTGNIMEVATRIEKVNLLPGDALWVHTSSQQHMALFIRWADSAKTQAVVWEEYRTGTVAAQRTWTAARTAQFSAIRYKNVLEGDAKTCAAVGLNHTQYPALAAGTTSDLVKTAQCLLISAGFNTGTDGPTGTFDDTTAAAVRQFQSGVGLAATGSVDSHTWTALLSRGTTTQIQEGSSGDSVMRLQRALNAATGAALGVDGDFGPKTAAAVKAYQSSRGLTADGVVGPVTWGALQAGR